MLVVEDDDNARALLGRVLERNGLDVVECADAAGALRQLFDARPDLVVLDLNLPDLNPRSCSGWLGTTTSSRASA